MSFNEKSLIKAWPEHLPSRAHRDKCRSCRTTMSSAPHMAKQVPFRRAAQLCNALDYLARRPAALFAPLGSEAEDAAASGLTPCSASLTDDPDLDPESDWDPLAKDEAAPAFSLPDYPHIHLSNRRALLTFLRSALCAPDLERMAPYLWMMSTQSGANINPLHCQLVKGRQIVVCEDPRLHCVWIYSRIYLKPLPAFLLSHAFWDNYLCRSDTPLLFPCSPGDDHDGNTAAADLDILARSALGFLRTYSLLIQHPSDLALAHAHRLIPAGTTLLKLRALTGVFGERISDDAVSKRYTYGELRLSRLNFYGKFVLRRWHFMRVHTQYGEYFARFYGPLLFLFTALSLILNALQVEMAVEQSLGNALAANLPNGDLLPWLSFWGLSRWVAVLTTALISVLSLGLLVMLAWFHADEWKYAIKERLRKKRELKKAREV